MLALPPSSTNQHKVRLTREQTNKQTHFHTFSQMIMLAEGMEATIFFAKFHPVTKSHVLNFTSPNPFSLVPRIIVDFRGFRTDG